MKSLSSWLLKLFLAYAIAVERALIDILVGSRFWGSCDMFIVSACNTLFLSSSLRSSWCNSSQMYPRVVRDAYLMFMFSLFDVSCNFIISSFHSLRGISIAAIDEIIWAIYLLTRLSGDARVARMACFICVLNSTSRLIQKFSYCGSRFLLMIKFLNRVHAKALISGLFSPFAISFANVAKNFFYKNARKIG